LRDIGNSIIVVEHNDAFIKASDWVIEIGPGA
jgi:excinuclease ABC subunit A